MTTEHTYEPLTESEMQAFAAKTQAWWTQLTPREQALLRPSVRSAGAEEDDVAGYGDVEYAAYQLIVHLNALPALQLAVNAYWAMQSPSAPSGAGGSTGGTLGTRTAMN